MPELKLKHNIFSKESRFRLFLFKLYVRFVKIRGEPKSIALGFALGLMVGMSPTMGIQTILAVFVASLFTGNKISAVAGAWISNPLTFPIVYGPTCFVGMQLVGLFWEASPAVATEGLSFLELLRKAPLYMLYTTVGGIALGIPLSIAGYYLAYHGVIAYRRRVKEKLKLRFARLKEAHEARRTARRLKKKKMRPARRLSSLRPKLWRRKKDAPENNPPANEARPAHPPTTSEPPSSKRPE